ncbi:G-protein coupled receptor 35 [Sarcophilus harrisii]|uniref:G protein-coupled receptor 35 n=1 Tax=Sarcophilus harrisii TaxID=9305 RepID=A0A7N4NGQ0_SARHA|nr:G-protein coupled receptor 35 [Sarcophilus harrisii]
MNGTEKCPHDNSTHFQKMQTVYMIILLILGIMFNSLALWVFCCRMRKKWTETVIYMTNLAVADLCLLCALPIMLYSQKHIKEKDTVLCQVSQSIYLMNRYMSISIITIIAVDRYVAIRFPMQAKRLRSPGRSVGICALLWVLVIIFTVTSGAKEIQEGNFCFHNEKRKPSNPAISSVLGFYIPMSILVFCSIQVIVNLVRKKKTDAHEKKVIQKVIWIITANLLVFLACFLPLYVTLSVRYVLQMETCSSKRIWRNAIFITSQLANANCCLDAICYYFVAKEFQEASVQTISSLSKSHKLQDSVQTSNA